ncbi:MAG: DOMON-like domain-containing protein [Azoarcus sp.]|jgi:hypothetical protein|nr:DOMON-like domain-containing protein [Azoarcus sp.]
MTSNVPPASRIPAITVGLRPFVSVSPADGGPPAVSALLSTLAALPGGGARFVFALEGRIEALRLPTADDPPRDPLWRHTCFEVFLAAPGEEAYHEFNFSPAGPWAASQFQRYRELARRIDAGTAPPPAIACTRRGDGLTLEVGLPSVFLPSGPVLRAGLTAVIEHDDGRLEYWAVHHPAEQPDFHHSGGWTLKLDTRLAAR